MTKMIYLLIMFLFLSVNLFAKKSFILNEVVKDIIKYNLNLEYYYKDMFVFRRAPLYKEEVLNYPDKNKIIKFNKYKDEFLQARNIKLKELKQNRIQGVDVLIFLKKDEDILYTIEMGYDIGINDKRYKFNEEFKEIISRIIPEYYGEEWKEEYNNYMKKTNKN